jgi:hypothetical protein
MKNKAIVVTTINPPTEALIKFAALPDFTVFVAGDNKGPKEWQLDNSVLLSMQTQTEKYPEFAKIVSENHYARKNIAYIEAIKSGAEYLYESDDDNIPYDFFPAFKEEALEVEQVTAEPAFNIYSLFTKDNIWPRGLPLTNIQNPVTSTKKVTVKPLIQQSLADSDPDVDAIYRLTNGSFVHFDKNKTYSLAKHTYCPFNSQNTYWDKAAFALLYLPSTVESRVTDIWRGYIAQRIIWEMDSEMIFSSASVYQERNFHNLQRDFEQELDLYLKSSTLIQDLDALQLSGTPGEMLMQTYEALTEKGYFKQEELAIVARWLQEIA